MVNDNECYSTAQFPNSRTFYACEFMYGIHDYIYIDISVEDTSYYSM